MERPRLAITMGDPAGVGAEVIAKALADRETAAAARYVVLGDRRGFERLSGASGAVPEFETVRLTADAPAFGSRLEGLMRKTGSPLLVDFANAAAETIAAHAPTAKGGRAAIEYVERAIDLARAGAVDAIVTAPISKAAWAQAGFRYAGHTDLLAERTEAARHAMMFVAPQLRVTLVSIHQSLRQMLADLRPERVLDAVELTYQALVEWFGVARPRIAVTGVNPHAGEEGLFGDEEARTVAPAVETTRERGIDCAGPLPADTVFRRAVEGEFDAVVAMYHDQGLIPVKLLAFHEAVNLTLGLPIVRTSVDHGTAYDIAGAGRANPGSMMAAIRLAVEIVRLRRTN
jgi:4-hydroxythreonine-4-phosphate dehydrogenase